MGYPQGSKSGFDGSAQIANSSAVDRPSAFAAVADERRQLADLLDGLSEQELALPSLCAGWDIKTVAAHIVSTIVDGTTTFLWHALRRGGMDRGIDELARRRAKQPTVEIVTTLREVADRRVSPPGAGPLDPLADVLVHAGDIRLPLGLPFEPDQERAALALDFLTGHWRFALTRFGLIRRLRLRATDLDRTWREGSEIDGPVAALMLCACGRLAMLDQLTGPGLQILQDRLSS